MGESWSEAAENIRVSHWAALPRAGPRELGWEEVRACGGPGPLLGWRQQDRVGPQEKATSSFSYTPVPSPPDTGTRAAFTP